MMYNFFYLHRKTNQHEWIRIAYVPFQLVAHLYKKTLDFTICKDKILYTISCYALGNDIWHS